MTGSCFDTETTAGIIKHDTLPPMNICRDDKRPNCFGECTILVKHETQLESQKLLHTEGKSYSCDICRKPFERLHDLKQHQLFHGDKAHSCETCGSSFTLIHDLRNHQVIHTGQKPYKCKLCVKQFSFSSSVAPHMRTHIGDRPYKCKNCYKSFTTLSI